MPRYYFETDDDDFRCCLEDGIELPSDQDARREALAASPDMARDLIPDGDYRTFRSIVRDANGDIAFEGELRLKGIWHKAPASPNT